MERNKYKIRVLLTIFAVSSFCSCFLLIANSICRYLLQLFFGLWKTGTDIPWMLEKVLVIPSLVCLAISIISVLITIWIVFKDNLKFASKVTKEKIAEMQDKSEYF